MNHPHDLFFKEAFSRKGVVRSFIEYYLADDDRKIINPETLEAVKDSHITTDLLEFFSDGLYSALTPDGLRRVKFLCLIHQNL